MSCRSKITDKVFVLIPLNFGGRPRVVCGGKGVGTHRNNDTLIILDHFFVIQANILSQTRTEEDIVNVLYAGNVSLIER